MTRVILLPRRARPFFARHPWVYASSIGRVEGPAEPGDEVAVVSHEGQFVARGLFNPRSAIRVRLYRWDDGPLDDAFWRGRIAWAVGLRTTTLGDDDPEGASRLVFSEADGLSGLTVDRYGQWLVVQFTSMALLARRDAIVAFLMEITGAQGAAVRVDRAIASQEGLPTDDLPGVGAEMPEEVVISENGLRYRVHPRSGQKTGFFLDQKENRRAVSRYARGRSVLDLFCYTGGFGLNAIKGGSTHSLGLDSSAPAVESARHNAVLNEVGSARFEVADVFDALAKIRERGDKFGLIVADPPKFAKGPRGVEDAVKGYLRLNRLAVDALESGGILATCSCSGLIDRDVFAGVIAQVAELSGRTIQILESRGASPDHPISVSCPETAYLKCLICHVS